MRASGWLVAALTVVPIALSAQNAPERHALFQLRDSLAAVRDTTGLLGLERRGIDSARANRGDAMLHVRLGLVGLRLAEITGGASHFRDAEGELQWATELRPQWPLSWYTLARAELAEADRFPTGMRSLLSAFGHDVFSQPARDFARSAEVDPTFTSGIAQLADSALDRGSQAHLTTALAVLRQLAHAPAGRSPVLLLARGRIEREVGDVDSALVAFEALVARERSNSTALLELARTRLEAGRLSGVAPWYLGLSLADSVSLPLYRFDLSLVMSDSALHAFDVARGHDRTLVAQRFWDSRDPETINGSAERLREHYRRIAVSHRSYALTAHRYDTVPRFDPTGSRFDDRGRIYVRHGEPDARTTLNMAGIPPNESWLYRRPGGDLLFNFALSDSAKGYRLYESLLDIVGLGKAAQQTGQGDVSGRLAKGTPIATFGAAWTAQAAEELLYSRQQMSPLYGKMLSAGPRGAVALQQTERLDGRKSIATGLQTDSWKFGYELPLAASVDILAVGSDARGTQIQVAFAIPGSSLYATPGSVPAIYPVRTRVTVRAASGELVAGIDTLRNFTAAAPLGDNDNLLGRIPVTVPPGNYQVRVALETPSRGLVTKAQSIHVAALRSTAIELSDLALGARRVGLPWATGSADTAWVNPLHRFASTDPLQLFFEVGGLAIGSSYTVELTVARSGRNEPQLKCGFTTAASAAPAQVHREIDIARLGTGNFVLQVAVVGPGGVRAVRRREFTIGRP